MSDISSVGVPHSLHIVPKSENLLPGFLLFPPPPPPQKAFPSTFDFLSFDGRSTGHGRNPCFLLDQPSFEFFVDGQPDPLISPLTFNRPPPSLFNFFLPGTCLQLTKDMTSLS